MHQQDGKTEVLEQPVEFRTLSAKYTKFATDFVLERAKTDEPFFLYVPLPLLSPPSEIELVVFFRVHFLLPVNRLKSNHSSPS